MKTNLLINNFSDLYYMAPKTRKVVVAEGGSQKLRELIGDAKEFVMSEVPTKRAVLQCAIWV